MQFVHAPTVFRLDVQHYAFQHATGKRFFAPITEPRRAIDIGTGTGTWMLVSIYTVYIMSAAYRCLYRKWPRNFRNVSFSALTLLHCSQPLYCRETVVLNLLMYLKVLI
jgi:hypothetical protein